MIELNYFEGNNRKGNSNRKNYDNCEYTQSNYENDVFTINYQHNHFHNGSSKVKNIEPEIEPCKRESKGKMKNILIKKHSKYPTSRKNLKSKLSLISLNISNCRNRLKRSNNSSSSPDSCSPSYDVEDSIFDMNFQNQNQKTSKPYGGLDDENQKEESKYTVKLQQEIENFNKWLFDSMCCNAKRNEEMEECPINGFDNEFSKNLKQIDSINENKITSKSSSNKRLNGFHMNKCINFDSHHEENVPKNNSSNGNSNLDCEVEKNNGIPSLKIPIQNNSKIISLKRRNSGSTIPDGKLNNLNGSSLSILNRKALTPNTPLNGNQNVYNSTIDSVNVSKMGKFDNVPKRTHSAQNYTKQKTLSYCEIVKISNQTIPKTNGDVLSDNSSKICTSKS